MKPVSPVFPQVCSIEHPYETIYSRNQQPYIPLPVVKEDGGIVTARWHMDWKERLIALLHGDVYVQINTFNEKLQPSRVFIRSPHEEVMSNFGSLVPPHDKRWMDLKAEPMTNTIPAK